MMIKTAMKPKFMVLRSNMSMSTTAVADPPIIWETNRTASVLTLNRPKILNPLSYQTCVEVKQKLIEWNTKQDANAFIIKSTGKAFCAGGDIKSLWQHLMDHNGVDLGTAHLYCYYNYY